MFGITRAPEIDRPGLIWFNTGGPLSLAALRGRLVILDFWTFCCINCLQILPLLRQVEEVFPGDVAVIGVHSPKFAAERQPSAVGQAIQRHGIHHPVVHDPEMRLWGDYGVRAWPTLVFLSPDGHVIGQLSGEPDPEALLEGLGAMIGQFRKDGSLHPRPLPPMVPAPAGEALRFPGKIKPCLPSATPFAAAPWGETLWAVADGGHHQIVLLDEAGREVTRYGSGMPGLADGPADRARFCQPQGLACDDRFLWVADTGSHALRRIDRAGGAVTTVAGDGRRGPVLAESRPAAEVSLASPWDVEVLGGQVYFANAGTHQIGRYDPADESVQAVAGTGGEDIVDGPAALALLAQPSGLAALPGADVLYIADAETSAVRRLRLDGAPHLDTLAGQGLFTFGHQDGAAAAALLQHPLGLAVDGDGTVLVADSYNGVLRRLDPVAGTVSTLDPGQCADPLCLPWGEPAGLAVAGKGRLLVSDTNNHRILEVDLAQGWYRTWAK